MRSYLITNLEKKIIKRFLESNNHLEGYRMLVHRAKKLDLKELREQLNLLEKFLKKLEAQV
jgi:hypothetical protein